MKQEHDTKEEEQTAEDIFSNDIIIPRANPVSTKERRESKEKSKKEIEEEEREKMQYVFNLGLYCLKKILRTFLLQSASI